MLKPSAPTLVAPTLLLPRLDITEVVIKRRREKKKKENERLLALELSGFLGLVQGTVYHIFTLLPMTGCSGAGFGRGPSRWEPFLSSEPGPIITPPRTADSGVVPRGVQARQIKH